MPAARGDGFCCVIRLVAPVGYSADIASGVNILVKVLTLLPEVSIISFLCCSDANDAVAGIRKVC